MIQEMDFFIRTKDADYEDPVYLYASSLAELLPGVEAEMIIMDNDQRKRTLLLLKKGLDSMKGWLSDYESQYKTKNSKKIYLQAKEGKISRSLNIDHFVVLSTSTPLFIFYISDDFSLFLVPVHPIP